LGALYRNPDFYRGIKGEIAAEDFSVGIHGRIFTLLAERIEEHRSLELTSFSQELAGEEMDIFVQIIKKNENLNHTFKVCSDCVQVMTEEREKRQQNVSAATLSDEDFLALINQQKKGI